MSDLEIDKPEEQIKESEPKTDIIAEALGTAKPEKAKKESKVEAKAETKDVAATKLKEETNGHESSSGEDARPQKDRQVEPTQTQEGVAPELEVLVPSWRVREVREETERRVKAELEAKYQAELQQLKQQQPQVKVPDRETEYDAWLEHQITTTQQNQERLNREIGLQNIDRSYSASVRYYKEANPDFDNCLNNMAEIYAQQLMEDGLTKRQIEEKIIESVRGMTVQAMREGKDPAEFIYKQGKFLPRLPHYSGQQAKEQPKAPVKREPDIARLAQNKIRNTGLSGESSDTTEEIPAILNENPVSLALANKEKQAEYAKARKKILSRLSA